MDAGWCGALSAPKNDAGMAVITLALLVVGWWRQRNWYRRAIVIPASGVIAATGLFWTVQRIVLVLR